MDREEKMQDLDELLTLSNEDVLDPDKIEEKRNKREERRREKEARKEEKELIKEEKRQIRNEKKRIAKRNFILLLKIMYSIAIMSLTGFINSCSFMFFGFSKLSLLIVIPSIFILVGLFIPLVWVKSDDRGFFFLMWLLCTLMFVFGLFLPTLVFEWNTVVIGINGFFDIIRTVFGG